MYYSFTEFLANTSAEYKSFQTAFFAYQRYITDYCKVNLRKRPTLIAKSLQQEYSLLAGSGEPTESADAAASQMVQTSIGTILNSHKSKCLLRNYMHFYLFFFLPLRTVCSILRPVSVLLS